MPRARVLAGVVETAEIPADVAILGSGPQVLRELARVSDPVRGRSRRDGQLGLRHRITTIGMDRIADADHDRGRTIERRIREPARGTSDVTADHLPELAFEIVHVTSLYSVAVGQELRVL